MRIPAKRGVSASHVHKARVGGVSSAPLGALTNKNVEVIAELEKAANAKRNKADIVADVISGFVGSMLFIYIHVLWFGAWIIVNTALSTAWRFDPYPFTFLTFVVSLEAIFLSTFILISQNHEELLATRRNHLDLQINLLSEQENSQMLKMLANIETKLGIRHQTQEDVLKEDVEPKALASQIERGIEGSEKNSRHNVKK